MEWFGTMVTNQLIMSGGSPREVKTRFRYYVAGHVEVGLLLVSAVNTRTGDVSWRWRSWLCLSMAIVNLAK